jgi:LPXTG-motif cell wall-anchored protein
LAGVTVALRDTLGAVVATTVTDGNGFYAFTDLTPSTAYTATFSAPAGYHFTTATTGAAATDSNPDLTTGVASFTTPETGTNSATHPDDPTIDAGFYLPVSVGDYVWHDANINGIQDANEAGIAGVVVTLTTAGGVGVVDANGNPVAPQTTDANGHYDFANLPPGQYTVTVTTPPAGLQATKTGAGSTATDSSTASATSVVLTSGASDATLDFGFWAGTDVLGTVVLPATGATIGGQLGLALAFLLAGLGLSFVGRRRRSC